MANTRSTSFDSIEIAAENLMLRKTLIMKVSRRRLKLSRLSFFLENTGTTSSTSSKAQVLRVVALTLSLT